MEKTNSFDLENSISMQQRNIDNLFAEVLYLNQDQWLALDDPSKMTQSIFNGIQLRRMEIGPALKDIATSIFLQYPEFAINYADRLERALNRPSSSISNGNLGINTKYEKMRQNILFEFGYDIGSLD